MRHVPAPVLSRPRRSPPPRCPRSAWPRGRRRCDMARRFVGDPNQRVAITVALDSVIPPAPETFNANDTQDTRHASQYLGGIAVTRPPATIRFDTSGFNISLQRRWSLGRKGARLTLTSRLAQFAEFANGTRLVSAINVIRAAVFFDNTAGRQLDVEHRRRDKSHLRHIFFPTE